MLTPSKDYTAIQSFELCASQYTRTVITTPSPTALKAVSTAASFIRFRLSGTNLRVQIIPWANIDDPNAWSIATNAFTDPLGFAVDQWDVVQYASNKILLIFQKTGEDFCRHKVYTDGAGWAADARNGSSATPPMAIYAIPYFGHVEIGLSGSSPSILYFRTDLYANFSMPILGDPVISQAYGFYSGTPILVTRNASNELRIYYPISYVANSFSYTWHMKWGRAASALTYSQAGDTIFMTENGCISQGYNPLYMRTIYSFAEMPNAKYNNAFYTMNGIKYTRTSTPLGQISEFSQDWKKFSCKVPILGNTYTEPCTVLLRRNYTDGSTSDSNPMLVDDYSTDVFSNNIFHCSKIWDAPAYSPLLHHVAESQPHLLFTHSLPYSPVAVKNQGTTIYNLLERYKLVMSHDQAQLLIKNNTNPAGTLDYDLYKTVQQNAHAINLMYTNDSLSMIPDLITGDQPTSSHNIGFLTANVTRTNLIKNYAFGFKRMFFEQPPQYFQVGDVITIDAAAGMIDDIQESFSQARWRQTLTALVA